MATCMLHCAASMRIEGDDCVASWSEARNSVEVSPNCW